MDSNCASTYYPFLNSVNFSFSSRKLPCVQNLQAIRGYRETEKSHWSDVNRSIIDRLKRTATTAVEGKVLTPIEEVHVLDLAKDGHIKPHTDSVKVQSCEKGEQ